ncbi:MAG: hypothetical protein F6J93_01225 [Oscillatoria sp. SIO1A7]|nr:hypothetical protein [Oscillatoria sp. SIO1A7]
MSKKPGFFAPGDRAKDLSFKNPVGRASRLSALAGERIIPASWGLLRG